ncbi:MAG: phosphatidylserine/phosphatidylglycerophosphate/cardiolipin synthase family protein [Candidatus Nomurabacteria bacterium]|nr:phosphatidylserine/phosphatidylglycerophosphate/cardiolipin synthase family protein [Candidatus Nomurabacteria bacterium]
MSKQKIQPKLLLTSEYLEQAIQVTKRAKKRICLLAFIIADDGTTHELIQEILAAADRGVEVNVAIDFITKVYSSKLLHTSTQSLSALIKEFRDHGVKVNWLGRDDILLLVKRTHSKWYVVDDTVFSFGGININSKHFLENVDFALRIDNRSFADTICEEQRIIETSNQKRQPVRSHSVSFDEDSVIFDGDIWNNSLIYRRSVELAERASEILLVSQYYPSGKLNKILQSKKSRIYYNNPKDASISNRVLILMGQKFKTRENLYKREKYIHAKFIIYTMPDGTKTALVGSHNFFKATSVLATREVALETKNPKTIAQLEKFFREQIA